MEHDLDKALIEYGTSDIYPFHMPGHKRQRLLGVAPEEIDITEIDGFDDLHHADGILRAGQERLARLFGADESFYLVNGSTAGVLAAVCGCMEKGGRLLVARNCHESVYHAAELMEARLSFLEPERVELPPQEGCERGTDSADRPDGSALAEAAWGIPGSISPAQVQETLRQFPDTQAVVITSPTYDGVVSDICAIADLVHMYGIPLIVDAAHGAHFGFSEAFPPKAIALGADLSVESLHKTLPAYTQSSALHLMRAGVSGAERAAGAVFRFDDARVRRYLDIFQSTSPSYVLMAGIAYCVRMIEEDATRYRDPATRADSLFGRFEERLARFYRDCEGLHVVQVFPAKAMPAADASAEAELQPGLYARDPSRILISATAAGLSGQQLYDLLLKKYHLQMERATEQYVLALTTIMDTDEGFARLFRALTEIDQPAATGDRDAVL